MYQKTKYIHIAIAAAIVAGMLLLSIMLLLLLSPLLLLLLTLLLLLHGNHKILPIDCLMEAHARGETEPYAESTTKSLAGDIAESLLCNTHQIRGTRQ